MTRIFTSQPSPKGSSEIRRKVLGDGRIGGHHLAVHGAVEVADGLDRFDLAQRLARRRPDGRPAAGRRTPGRSAP